MKQQSMEIINSYQKRKNTYKRLGEIVYNLLNMLIRDSVHTHQISFRIKDMESLSNKLVRKNYKYDSIDQITDILGLRIILYFEDDIYKVEEIIKSQFTVDEKNSMDKRSFDEDRFGYRSLHYIVSLDEKRLTLPEYSLFSNMKFEIQIRSILQHSWAEIEHDIGYKGVDEIPSKAKRTFYRLAALLEQADIEFVKLKSELNSHESEVSQKISEDNANIPIDKVSLKAFIKESSTIKDIEMDIEKILCPREELFYDPLVVNLLPKLKRKGIVSILNLENSLIENKRKIMDGISNGSYPELANYKTFYQGSSILWLLEIIHKEENKLLV